VSLDEEHHVRAELALIQVQPATGESVDVVFCDSQWNSSGLMA
jgi:hypothetical protein